MGDSDLMPVAEIVLKVIPIIIIIARHILTGNPQTNLSAQDAAALALFEALIHYLDVAT